jgi:integrase
VWLSDVGKYHEKSLKTADLEQAKSRARRMLWEIEKRQSEGQPVRSKKMTDVIDAYVAMRETEYQRGKTKAGMLRQIKRIAKFWREYIGTRFVAEIGDVELKGYLPWRREYYTRKGMLPRNARLFPEDKTLQFEVMVGKAMLNWATDSGFRGNQPKLSWSFTAKNKRIRPAFSAADYEKLMGQLALETLGGPLHRMFFPYVGVLANSGIRVGEANNLRIRDVEKFEDDKGRANYRLTVRGKTGEREAIMFASASVNIDQLLLDRRGADRNDWLFVMPKGTKIITLIDQFKAVLKRAGVTHDSAGRPYTLYSLRHYYAVQALRKGISIYSVALNMGTSVQMIQTYYASTAKTRDFATALGD